MEEHPSYREEEQGTHRGQEGREGDLQNTCWTTITVLSNGFDVPPGKPANGGGGAPPKGGGPANADGGNENPPGGGPPPDSYEDVI